MRWSVLPLLVLIVAVASCASPQQQIAGASVIKTGDDKFRPFKEYSSGPIRTANENGIGIKRAVARVDRQSGKLTAAIIFEIAYISNLRRTYGSARDGNARSLPVQIVAHDSSNCRKSDGECQYLEVISIDVPETELRNAPASGYDLKLFAKVGPDAQISMPKEILVHLFAKIDSDRGANGATASVQ